MAAEQSTSEQNFAIISPQLARVYERVRENHRLQLNTLTELANLRTFKRQAFARMLNTFALEVFMEIKSANDWHATFFGNKLDKKMHQYESDFGHLPPTAGTTMDGVSPCVANAVAQNLLLDVFGANAIGTVEYLGHIAPTIRVRGNTFVLDPNYFHKDGALTFRDYLKELQKDQRYHPLEKVRESLREAFPQENPTLTQIYREMEVTNGAGGAIASIHRNLGVAFLLSNNLKNARMHFERAVELTPNNAAARIQLGEVCSSQGDLISATKHFKAAARLNPNNSNVRKLPRTFMER